MSKTRYEAYMKSDAWKRKREARLALDGFRCRMCDETGERYALQVHHRPDSYKEIPNESVDHDLTTLCTRCHDLITNVIREDRYGKKQPPILDHLPAVERKLNDGTPNRELPAPLVLSIDGSLRPIGEPVKPLVQTTEADYIQAQEDRRGLRRDGAH